MIGNGSRMSYTVFCASGLRIGIALEESPARSMAQLSFNELISHLLSIDMSLVVYRISTRACQPSGRARAGFDSPPGSGVRSIFQYHSETVFSEKKANPLHYETVEER